MRLMSFLGLAVSPGSLPEYATVTLEDDPPPPYPGSEDEPPPYSSVVYTKKQLAFNSDVRAGIPCFQEDFQDIDSNDHRQPRRKHCGALFVAWFDIILNVFILVLFLMDVIVRKWNSLSTLWIAHLNVLWIRAAFRLHQSTDTTLSREERHKLALTWRRFNHFLMFILGILTVLSLVLALALLLIATNKGYVIGLIGVILLPVSLRILFGDLVYNYIKTY